MDKNKNGKIEDFLSAVKEDGILAVSETELFKQSILESADLILQGPAAPIIGTIIAAVVPRTISVYLLYKQHRFERNIKLLVDELELRVRDLEENYQQLNSNIKQQFNNSYVEMLLDAIVDEPQEEKIEHYANAFVTLMTNDSNENLIRYFFKTLTELTVLDIDILRWYSHSDDIDRNVIQHKYGIDDEYVKVVKEKLVRFGLLFRKNDQLRDKNIDEISEYLIKAEADSKKSKPHGVKFPRTVKKIGHSDVYGITSLGLSLLKCIGDN